MRNPQAWTGALTLQSALGPKLEWFQVVGLIKGVERDGRRSTPLAWGYRYDGQGPTKVAAEDFWQAPDGRLWRLDYTAAKSWVRHSTDDYPGGVEAWITALPQGVLDAQFAMTEAVDIEWDLAEEWLANQSPLVERTQAWQRAVETVADPSDLAATRAVLFPRDGLDGTCLNGSWGKPCGMYSACFNAEVGADPLSVYKRREPHHPLERAQLGEQL